MVTVMKFHKIKKNLKQHKFIPKGTSDNIFTKHQKKKCNAKFEMVFPPSTLSV